MVDCCIVQKVCASILIVAYHHNLCIESNQPYTSFDVRRTTMIILSVLIYSMFVIIDGNFVIFVRLSEIEEIKILEEDMQQQSNITSTKFYSPYDATTMTIHNFTYLFFHQCEDA